MSEAPLAVGGPEWFERAMAIRPLHRTLDVDGASIHYRVWGPAGSPGLILVHGAGAHSGWWDHIAPQLSAHRVVALDPSGHGDSAHRCGYDMRQWAAEIVAAGTAEGLDQPLLVGHSMGGRAAVAAGVEHRENVSAVVVIDSPLNLRRPEAHRRPPAHSPASYPTVEDAVARFRTRPRDARALPFVRDSIARDSLRRADGGWTWKSGQQVFGVRPSMQDLLPRLARPVALVRGEHGQVPASMVGDIARLVRGPLPVIDLPDTGHHPMLDRPLALVAALRALLAVWPTAEAERRSGVAAGDPIRP